MQNHNLEYIKPLNGLRALAVILVLIHHWSQKNVLISTFNPGLIGVIIFFVLSGFLITRILLQARLNKKIKILPELKRFYIRRALRIFPVFYFLLFVLYILNFQEIRMHFIWFLTYTQNILFYTNPENNFGYVIHFWTLAIEEQFYLIWPFIILLFKPNKTIYICIIFIMIASILRWTMPIFYNGDHGPITYLLPGAMDGFAWGALLAFMQALGVKAKINYGRLAFVSFLVLLSNLFLIFIPIFDYYTCICILSFCLIGNICENTSTVAAKIFNLNAVQYIGKISYGIYLFHYLIYPFNHWLHKSSLNIGLHLFGYNLVVPEFGNPLIRFIWFFFLTLTLASLSWYMLEKPVLKLKNTFFYK